MMTIKDLIVNDETYEPWYCEKLSTPMRVLLKSFSYNENSSLDIHVCNLKNFDEHLIIRFPELPIAMRVTNESQRLVTLHKMKGQFSHFICVVQNSNFLSWLNYDSLGIYKDDPWKHFSIVEDNEWIDVITSDLPEIIFL
jgi:hypothetical protein